MIERYLETRIGRGKIILEYYHLVKKIAGSYAAKYPDRAEDIFGVAKVFYLLAIERAPDKELDNERLEYYLRSYIKGGIQRFIITDHLIKVNPNKITEDFVFPQVISDLSKVGEWDYYDFMFDDLLNFLRLTEAEKEVVILKMVGYRQNEIAKHTGKSKYIIKTITDSIKRKISKHEI